MIPGLFFARKELAAGPAVTPVSPQTAAHDGSP